MAGKFGAVLGGQKERCYGRFTSRLLQPRKFGNRILPEYRLAVEKRCAYLNETDCVTAMSGVMSKARKHESPCESRTLEKIGTWLYSRRETTLLCSRTIAWGVFTGPHVNHTQMGQYLTKTDKPVCINNCDFFRTGQIRGKMCQGVL